MFFTRKLQEPAQPTVVYKTTKEWQAEKDAWKKKHPILNFLKYDVYYPVYRFFDRWFNFKQHSREIKWKLQRVKKGYSTCDVWGLTDYLADVILGATKELREMVHGHPCDLKDLDEWKMILDNIIYTFEIEKLVLAYDAVFESSYKTKKLKKLLEEHKKTGDIRIITREEEKKYNQGWKYFKQYFRGMWD